MTIKDLRKVIPNDVTVCLQKEDGSILGINEFSYFGEGFDAFVVNKVYPERYPGVGASGITIEMSRHKEGDENNA